MADGLLPQGTRHPSVGRRILDALRLKGACPVPSHDGSIITARCGGPSHPLYRRHAMAQYGSTRERVVHSRCAATTLKPLGAAWEETPSKTTQADAPTTTTTEARACSAVIGGVLMPFGLFAASSVSSPSGGHSGLCSILAGAARRWASPW